MTQRRQAGFIKNYSSTQTHFQDQPSEFSYFRMRPKADDDEFSPYKFQQDAIDFKNTKKPAAKPPLPKRSLQKVNTMTNLGDRAKADRLYNKIRQNISSYQQKRSANRQNLQENIGSVRNRIEKLDEMLKDLEAKKSPSVERKAMSYEKKRRFQEDSSSSSSSEQEVAVKAIPSPKIPEKDFRPAQYNFQDENQEQRYQEVEEQHEHGEAPMQNQFSSSSKLSSPLKEDNIITFNSRMKDQPPLQIVQYSSSSSSGSDSQEQEVVVKSPSYQMPERTQPIIREKPTKDFYKNKGGVCFDIDVKQFTAPVAPTKEERPMTTQRKQKPVDKRVQLLKRREAAKAYDKVARRAVFSPHY